MNQTEENRDLALVRTRCCFNDVREWKKQWRKEAAKRVKGLPVAIRSQGLMVVIATLMSEDTPYSRHFADRLAQWLLKDAPHGSLRSTENGEPSGLRLLEVCMKASRAEYLAAEMEAIIFLDQVKLYADALYTVEGISS